jgi:hypothetical protein
MARARRFELPTFGSTVTPGSKTGPFTQRGYGPSLTSHPPAHKPVTACHTTGNQRNHTRAKEAHRDPPTYHINNTDVALAPLCSMDVA